MTIQKIPYLFLVFKYLLSYLFITFLPFHLFLYATESGFDAVMAQAAVGEGRANDVFREPVRENAQLEQLTEDG